ncbi:NTP pyrophosphohydrolase [Bifidobacterium parmae]|uniref:NTP pyrophosphohydrolase n=1 Tax=Bifidobacterium parmae TaxID=361854 RepID=A0A2N5J3D4_9BIFI|nr:NUDIX hydrolase [Bifidobacterium parmae]PLS28732.1 NTP pyrophosphohydrolase [Bifidobacterium parmae]
MSKIVEAAGGILYRRRRLPDDVARRRADEGSSVITTAAATDAAASAPTATTAAAAGIATGTAASPATAVFGTPRFDDIEVCLVHRPKYDDWSWPKGKVDPNESHMHAAVREIGEETGLPVALGPYLGDIEYPQSEEGSKQRHTKNYAPNVNTKHIRFWMATAISPVDKLKRTAALGPVHRADVGEIDDVIWLTPDKARKKLTHSTDKEILALFIDRLQEGAADAVPVILVRHGKAEARKSWKGTDANRPITPRGAAAAFALSHELACFNPVRLATSPWIRCMETLETFSWQTGRDMVKLDPLTEDAFAADPQAAWECFASEIEYALKHRSPAAICMHRPVIGGIFDHLRALCVSDSLAKRLIAKSPYMPTGSALALFAVATPKGPRIIDIQKVNPLVY